MKIFLSAFLATILLAPSALAGATDYAVSLINVGHVNSDGQPGHKFEDKRGDIRCHDGGCVGEGVIKVKVDNNVGEGELHLEVFPTRDNYAVSIMCREDDKELTECSVANCDDRGRNNDCNNDLEISIDTSTKKGCTITGDGEETEEVEIRAKCE